MQSFIIPHKPLVFSTISAWLKTCADRRKNDINIFKVHSNTSAFTSKVGLSDATIEEILKR